MRRIAVSAKYDGGVMAVDYLYEDNGIIKKATETQSFATTADASKWKIGAFDGIGQHSPSPSKLLPLDQAAWDERKRLTKLEATACH